MLIKIDHPQIDQQMTRLSDNVAASATSSTVENNDGFTTNDYVVFGKPGQELSEIVKLTSTTGNTTIGHTTGPVFAHNARTPIYLIKFNQAQIYRATSQTGTYSLITTVDLDIDEDYTLYDDTDGDTDSWYKVRYKNETTEALSEYSDVVQGTGYTEDSLYSISQEILEDFGDPDTKEVSRKLIYLYIRAGVRKIVIEIAKNVKGFMREYKAEAMDGSAEYTIPDNLIHLYKLRANYSGSSVADSYPVTIFTSKDEVHDQSEYSNQDPYAYWEEDSVGLVPTSNSTGYIFWYYLEAPTAMDDEIDEHGLPYGGRDLLVLYGLYRVWKSKNQDKGNSYKNDFKESLPDYIDFVAQSRQSVEPMKVKVEFGDELYT